MLSDPYTGRATGEAFVQFIGKDIAEKALQKHMQKIGHRYDAFLFYYLIDFFYFRYIEVFRSSAEEMRRFLRRAGGGGGGGGASGSSNSGGGAMHSSGGGGGGYPDWSTGAAPTSLFSAGYASMGAMGGGMMDAGYGAGGDLMYVSRSMRPTPYDRPSYAPAARSRPTPLVASMTTMGAYGNRGKLVTFYNFFFTFWVPKGRTGTSGCVTFSGYNGGGRMSGIGGSGSGSYKGYPEGGYASGAGGQFDTARGGNPFFLCFNLFS